MEAQRTTRGNTRKMLHDNKGRTAPPRAAERPRTQGTTTQSPPRSDGTKGEWQLPRSLHTLLSDIAACDGMACIFPERALLRACKTDTHAAALVASFHTLVGRTS